jgi:F0F1-type ATP synthase assembly protein I
MLETDMKKGGDGDKSGLNLGLYPAVGVLLGLGVGYWLGKKFGWGTWGPLGGSVVGLIAGMYLLIKEGMRISKD